MNETLLGKILNPKEPASRDAVHVAVAPMRAGETLQPGQIVGFAYEGTTKVVSGVRSMHGKAIGIVDPFLEKSVQEEEYFYVLLFPKTITSLHHVWEHPSFPLSNNPITISEKRAWDTSKEEAQRYLTDFATQYGWSFADLISAMKSWADGGAEYLGTGVQLSYEWNTDELWKHFRVYTGIIPKNRETHFSCAC